jgi:hypothetical protein
LSLSGPLTPLPLGEARFSGGNARSEHLFLLADDFFSAAAGRGGRRRGFRLRVRRLREHGHGERKRKRGKGQGKAQESNSF